MPLFLISFYKFNQILLYRMHLHFIAIGGAIMHQLAICSQLNGHIVTGSDDYIADPALSNLQKHDLLPPQIGWQASNIHEGIDAVILGMHAHQDNPELRKALQLKIPVYSFPEYILKHSENKTRIVIAGSHGKTTTTSMIMHCLKKNNMNFDYLVGAQVPGFEYSVRLSDAPIIIIEGDEYPASRIDQRPKIQFYQPHIATITGIAWDHINVFPTYDLYKRTFELFIEQMRPQHHIIYNAEDREVVKVMENHGAHLQKLPYLPADYKINHETDQIEVKYEDQYFPLTIFGDHNLQNLEAARRVCHLLGIDATTFYTSMVDFEGAARRLEKIKYEQGLKIFKDFAHAPSKVSAALKAMRSRYLDHHLIAILELHTYSSLNEEFISTYRDTLKEADDAVIFYSSEALKIKRIEAMSHEFIQNAFNQKDLSIFDRVKDLSDWINDQLEKPEKPVCILLMSSGYFDQMDLNFKLKNNSIDNDSKNIDCQ